MRGSAPSAEPRRVISARPRVISAARALSPKPRPSEMPGGDRDHVLGGAAQLHAAHVGRGVDAEARRRERALQRAGDIRDPSSRSTLAAGWPAAISSAWFGPESGATRLASCPVASTTRRESSRCVAGIEALRERDHERVGAQAQRGGRLGVGRGGQRERDQLGLGGLARQVEQHGLRRRPRAGCRAGSGGSRAAPPARRRRAGRGRRARPCGPPARARPRTPCPTSRRRRRAPALLSARPDPGSRARPAGRAPRAAGSRASRRSRA